MFQPKLIGLKKSNFIFKIIVRNLAINKSFCLGTHQCLVLFSAWNYPIRLARSETIPWGHGRYGLADMPTSSRHLSLESARWRGLKLFIVYASCYLWHQWEKGVWSLFASHLKGDLYASRDDLNLVPFALLLC